MITVSYSRISSYMSCPYKHYLSYVERITSKKPARPLVFGTDFHRLLEFRNNIPACKKILKEIETTFYDMPSSWQGDLGDNYPYDIKSIFQDYLKVYKNDPIPAKTEQKFKIPIGSYKGEKVYFVGVIDELYDTGAYNIIGEHKTFSQKPDMQQLAMNTQVSLYAKAVEVTNGFLPDAVLWDYIKSQPSAYPVWLEQSKRFSDAKSASITPYSWKRACKEKEISDKAILEKGKKYKDNIGNFFFKVQLDIIESMVNKLWDDFKYMAREVVTKSHKCKAKNVSRGCNWCGFRSICYTELTGGNVKHVLEKDFERRKK